MQKFSNSVLEKDPLAYIHAVTVTEHVDIAWLTYRDYGKPTQHQYRSTATDCTVVSHHSKGWSRLFVPPQIVWSEEGEKIITMTEPIWRWWTNFTLTNLQSDAVKMKTYQSGTAYLRSAHAKILENL